MNKKKSINHDMDLISIIIPVYNVSKYLRRCVDSVLNQSYSNIEIILVDDGSTDDSGAICDEYAKKEESVIVIHQHNQGLGPARNAGLNVMHGKYVGFVDSDDWVSSEMYECMHRAIVENKCDIATCGRLVVTDEGILSRVYCMDKGQKLNSEEAIEHYLIQKDMNMSACDKLFNSKLFDNVRFPGEFLVSEDIVPVYNLLKKSEGVFLTGKPYYHYFYRIGSLSRSNFSHKNMGSCIYAEKVSELVRKEYPHLKDAADYFSFDQVIGIYRVIRRSKYNGKEKRELQLKIKNKFWPIIRNPYVFRRQKIYCVLAIIGMDRILDKLYVVLKRKRQFHHLKKEED